MGRDGKPTRDKILAESKALIYENGFAGTSIDLILDKAGITKGAFFYHFKTKAELALVLMNEFAKADLSELERVSSEIAGISESKKRLLAFVQTFIDMFSSLEEPPGCLYASVSNEQNQYSGEIKKIVSDTILQWREALVQLLEAVEQHHAPKLPYAKEALADHFTVVMEGAFIVSKALGDASLTSRQLQLYHDYLNLLFEDKR